MIMHRVHALASDRRGVAAAEMAMVVPLLMVVMFGTFELGNYFYDNHIVIKGVRDGARYASRLGFAKYTCPSTVDTATATAINNVTRTGQTAAGGTPRLWNWNNASMVSVTLACTSNSSSTYSGIYEGHANVPVVRVTAIVPYSSLFGIAGFATASALTITAESEIPVMGV